LKETVVACLKALFQYSHEEKGYNDGPELEVDCIYVLFNVAVDTSKYIASNYKVISEESIGQAAEGAVMA
jgi:hypothetical protein